MNALSIRVLLASMSLVAVLSSHFVLAEDRVKDFENAINYMQDEKGCLSIPYSDLQNSCVAKQREVEKLCKESGQSQCGGIDPKNLQKQIELLKTERDEAKVEKDNLDRKKSSLKDEKEIRENDDKIKEAEGKIENANKKRDPLEKQVSESRRIISDRYELNKQCRDARKSVMEVFAAAKAKVNSETEENIKPIAKRLSDWYEKNEPGHETAIKNADKAIENCEKALYEIDHLGTF
jgi:chromosome segregation ATPase